MKVLDQGKKWKKEIICPDCRAKLLIDENDLFASYDYDYSGGCDLYYGIRCIICDNIIEIKEKIIPNGIQKKILKEFRGTIKEERER